jgi:hypothetical protein
MKILKPAQCAGTRDGKPCPETKGLTRCAGCQQKFCLFYNCWYEHDRSGCWAGSGYVAPLPRGPAGGD